jgi:chromosomal replication initiator protein
MSMMDHKSVWERCLRNIKKNVNAQSFRTWFEPIKPIHLEGTVLTIQVPNNFFYEWLEEHYVNLLRSVIREELGDQGGLLYNILSETDVTGKSKQVSNSNSEPSGKPKSSREFYPGTFQTDKIDNPFVIPGIRKVHVDPQLNPKYRFDNFIEGDCNKLGRSAGQAVSDNPGTGMFNPLFLFGPVGLGKTHLMHAIGNAVIEKFPEKNVLYVTSEQFTSQIIQAIKNNGVDDFVNFYHNIDVLIVDDIQFLASRTKTQEIFYNIFNPMLGQGKQIILSSDVAPKDMEGIQERLISRFKWGLTADLQVPDFETRMAIMQEKMEKNGMDVPKEVIEYLCFNLKTHVRELEGAVVSLMAQSSLSKRNIDMDLAKEVLKTLIKQPSREIDTSAIIKIVGDQMNVSVEAIKGTSRKRNVVMSRQIAMYLSKELTKSSLSNIGELFSGRDHSTVIYSCKTVKDLMDTDNSFKIQVQDLERAVKLTFTDGFQKNM